MQVQQHERILAELESARKNMQKELLGLNVQKDPLGQVGKATGPRKSDSRVYIYMYMYVWQVPLSILSQVSVCTLYQSPVPPCTCSRRWWSV